MYVFMFPFLALQPGMDGPTHPASSLVQSRTRSCINLQGCALHPNHTPITLNANKIKEAVTLFDHIRKIEMGSDARTMFARSQTNSVIWAAYGPEYFFQRMLCSGNRLLSHDWGVTHVSCIPTP